MRLLHTADWHVGKTLRGHGRADEHRAVLGEITGLVREHGVDLVVIAGDLFDTSSPAPESEQIVYDALLAFRDAGAAVVVVAGNHDNALRLAAVAPVFSHLAVHVTAHPSRPDAGGVLELTTAGGEPVRLVLLPFVSQRSIVRADDLMRDDGADHSLAYADRYLRLTEVLCDRARADAVNVMVGHTFVANGVLGGGERSAHTIFDYWVPSTVFPPTVQYVALGHLHRAQRLDGPTQIHYCGSPLALDFGEAADTKQVNLVELAPGKPAAVTAVALQAGRRLRTVRGSLEQLRALAADVDPLDYLRVVVHEAARAGLADEVRAVLPGAVDVVIERPAAADAPRTASRAGRTPHELFAEFCASRDHDDPRVRALFAELLEECGAAPSA